MLNEENPLSIFSSAETVSVGSVNESFERKLNDIEASLKSGKCSHLIVELCTADRSGFSQVTQTGTLHGLCVLAVTHDLRSVHLRLEAWIDMILAEFPKVSVMCWFSPHCSGGSPVLNLIANPRRAEILQRHWDMIEVLLRKGRNTFLRCHAKCLELSKTCSYWDKVPVQTFCRDSGLFCSTLFHRCAYTNENGAQAKHVFRVESNFQLREPRSCQCASHLPLNRQSLSQLGEYPHSFAHQIAEWFLTGRMTLSR